MGTPAAQPPIRALIFDMDGLLVDGETTADIALAELFERYGVNFDPHDSKVDHVWGLIGQKMAVVLAALAEVYDLDVPAEQLLRELDDLRVEKVIPEQLQAMPGAAEILAFGREAGLPMALATSGERRYADACLKATSFTGRFTAEVTGDQVSQGKPNPETFLLAAQRLGVDPAYCAVFEDAPAGVAAAVAGGMRAVAVPNQYSQSMAFPVAPDVSVPDLYAAIAWLRAQGVGAAAYLDAGAIAALRASLRGKLLLPGDADYDATRRVWNAMIDRTPALIVRAVGVADVIAAMAFAREQDLLIAVRGGGHNVAGNAVCDGGLMVDLSLMKGIWVDPAARTVRVEAGVTWGELDNETQRFGLAAVGGTVASTGISGLTLGGGFGWLARRHGLACDNLLSADVVPADGRLLHVSAEEYPELFWGLHGGGGNFGVVTSFEFRLHPVGPTILAGPTLYALDDAPQVFRAFRDGAAAAPDALAGMAGLLISPDGASLAALVLGWLGPLEEGEAAVRPLHAEVAPVADLFGPMPYCTAQALFDPAFPSGRRNYWKSGFLRNLDDGAIALLIEHFRRAPSPYAGMGVELYGGAISRVAPGETAFPHRNAPFNILIFTAWENPEDDAANMQWGRELWEALQPYAADGVYVNYLDTAEIEGSDRVQAAYGREVYARLAELKRTYDPQNLFRMNQNILPA